MRDRKKKATAPERDTGADVWALRRIVQEHGRRADILAFERFVAERAEAQADIARWQQARDMLCVETDELPRAKQRSVLAVRSGVRVLPVAVAPTANPAVIERIIDDIRLGSIAPDRDEL